MTMLQVWTNFRSKNLVLYIVSHIRMWSQSSVLPSHTLLPQHQTSEAEQQLLVHRNCNRRIHANLPDPAVVHHLRSHVRRRAGVVHPPNPVAHPLRIHCKPITQIEHELRPNTPFFTIVAVQLGRPDDLPRVLKPPTIRYESMLE